MKLIHNTTKESSIAILNEGFSFKHYRRSSKRTGWDDSHKPKGFFFLRDEGQEKMPHPFKHGEFGVLIRCSVDFKNPVFVESADELNAMYGKGGESLTKALKAAGFDGVITPLEIIVFDAESITVLNV